MFLRSLPPCLSDNFEMLRPIRIASDPHNHLGAFLNVVIHKDVSTHPLVSVERKLALRIACDHLRDNFIGRRWILRWQRNSAKCEQDWERDRKTELHVRTPKRISRGIPARSC